MVGSLSFGELGPCLQCARTLQIVRTAQTIDGVMVRARRFALLLLALVEGTACRSNSGSTAPPAVLSLARW